MRKEIELGRIKRNTMYKVVSRKRIHKGIVAVMGEVKEFKNVI